MDIKKHALKDAIGQTKEIFYGLSRKIYISRIYNYLIKTQITRRTSVVSELSKDIT